MEEANVARGCDSAIFNEGREITDEELDSIVRLYFKDPVYGTFIKRELQVNLEDFHDFLDANPEIGNKFNEKLCELASNRIERSVDVCIANLVDSLAKSGEDIQSLKVIQASIQTLSTIKRTYKNDPIKANKKLSDFERALMEYGG